MGQNLSQEGKTPSWFSGRYPLVILNMLWMLSALVAMHMLCTPSFVLDLGLSHSVHLGSFSFCASMVCTQARSPTSRLWRLLLMLCCAKAPLSSQVGHIYGGQRVLLYCSCKLAGQHQYLEIAKERALLNLFEKLLCHGQAQRTVVALLVFLSIHLSSILSMCGCLVSATILLRAKPCAPLHRWLQGDSVDEHWATDNPQDHQNEQNLT